MRARRRILSRASGGGGKLLSTEGLALPLRLTLKSSAGQRRRKLKKKCVPAEASRGLTAYTHCGCAVPVARMSRAGQIPPVPIAAPTRHI